MKKITFSFVLLFTIYSNAFNQNWSSVGDFTTGWGSDIRVLYNDTVEDKLFIGGMFLNVNSMKAYSIVKYNGISFDTLSNVNMQGQIVVEITRFNNKIYIGGFVYCLPIYDKPCGVAYYENNSWIFCGGGIDANVGLLFPLDTTLLIGGLMQYIQGGDTLDGMITWNGSSYYCCMDDSISRVGNNSPLCAIIWHDTLLIGGNFHLPDGNRIAYWNGSKFISLGGGLKTGSYTWVNTMIEYKGDLYIAGYFEKSTGNAGNFIQRWDGHLWHDVGGGVCCGQIFDMTVFNNELYVVGAFNYAGGVPANYIAKWDGTKWCGFGNTFNNIIETVEVYHNELYIGGSFKKIDNDSIYLFAKWTGNNYTDTCGFVGIQENNISSENIIIYPNPANTSVEITTNNEQIIKEVKLYTIEGKLINKQSFTETNVKINSSQLPTGMYIVKVQTNKKQVYQKLLISH
ncbi:MAG: hypothetical protein A2X08_05350 [Bacteroidetes bacterium GWA2_32_17]|nr:MAG: hypothetical protein A2X08_05350 [Bacteroidetes bacterium GWA2_32_17]